MNPINNILVIVDPTAEQHPAAEKERVFIGSPAEDVLERLPWYALIVKPADLLLHYRSESDLRVSAK